MFTFSNLGKYGRLGNQLFQIAAIASLAKKHGVGYFLPPWPYQKYFKSDFNCLAGDVVVSPTASDFYEPHHHFADITLDVFGLVDIHGYFQSEKYIDKSIDFSFEEEFLSAVRKHFEKIICFDTVAVHIRRGDYVNHPDYVQLPIDYYHRALELIPKDAFVLIFSDDIEWCKKNFIPARPMFFYVQEGSDVEDLALMSQCTYHIISNSTFSWWGAYLANSKKVIAPDKWYAGNLAKTHSEKDVVPERWIKIPSFEVKKIDLRDVTFTIPVKIDHPDRKENLFLLLSFLRHHFDTNIIVFESFLPGEERQLDANFGDIDQLVFVKSEIFHRTSLLNVMATFAKTPFIANWDADILVDPKQIVAAVEALRKGKADGVYPYDGKFLRVDRKHYQETLNKLSVDHLVNLRYPRLQHEQKSFGGAILWNKKSFIAGGMENENFISYGPEDYERAHRFPKLGFKVGRIGGPLYHMNHWIGPDSSSIHPDFHKNVKEFEKIKSMDAPTLRQYVKSWPWVENKETDQGAVNNQTENSTELSPLLSLGFDKIYVINLDRKPERFKAAAQELEAVGISPVDRYPAVDGKTLNLQSKIERLTPGMIGCFQSHLQILKEAVEKDYDSICVFEDDVVFTDGFTDYMKEAIAQIPEDWQFIYLGCQEYGGFGDHLKQVNDFWVIPKCVWGTHAMMYRTKEAIKFIYDRLQKQEMQIDEQLASLVLPTSGLKYYALFPTNMIAQRRPEGEWESDVQTERQLVI
jgi:GR25 family glycosyltransferase involved in LPS biosynthesis